MKRSVVFDDEKHHCLLLEKGQPFIVRQEGLEHPIIVCAFDFRSGLDIQRAEKVLKVCRELIEISAKPAATNEAVMQELSDLGQEMGL